MAIKRTQAKMTCKLDKKPYLEMVRQTGEQARKALAEWRAQGVSP